MAETASEETVYFFPAAALAALLAIFFVYSTYTQKYVGASDWYGYYSEAQSFKQGRVTLEVSRDPGKYPSIAPLGYFVEDSKVLPYYPPGYPLLMALFGFLGLEFYVTPLLGTLSVLLMFLLLKDITGDKRIAVSFSLLWAFAPIVVYGSTSVMSDGAAAFFILLSLYLYRKGKIPLSALALGFSLAVRPTNALYCMVFLPVLLKDRHWFKFGCWLACPVSLYGIYNWHVYGSPWKFGYDNISERLSASIIPHHLVYYTTEILVQFTPVFVLLALFALYQYVVNAFKNNTLEKLSEGGEKIGSTRGLGEVWFFTAWFLIFFVFYCCWRPGGEIWWWTRFLLPAFPAMFFLAALGLKTILAALQTKGKKAVSAALTGFVLLSVIIFAYYIHYGFNHKDVWEIDRGKDYYTICKKIEETVPANSIVGSCEFSGCITLYSGIESFNSLHPISIRFIRRMLRENVPIYILSEPWHRKNPVHQQLFRLFKVSKIVDFPLIPGLELYRIKSRRFKAWSDE